MQLWYSNTEEDTLVLLALKILVTMKIQARLVGALLKKKKKVNKLPTTIQSLVDYLPVSFWMA